MKKFFYRKRNIQKTNFKIDIAISKIVENCVIAMQKQFPFQLARKLLY